jgi:RNA polymerase sigma-70 factor (ECF subfamily)
MSVIRRHAQGNAWEVSVRSANIDDTARLIERLRVGDRTAAADLLSRQRERLRRMIDLRLDFRLQGRLDTSDVLQEAMVDIAARLDDYLKDPSVPLFLWMRVIAGERLARVHRHHLGVKMRDAGRDVSLHRGALPAASSFALASMLLGTFTSPPQAAVRAERRLRVQQALDALDATDREVLALRHFEQLTPAEAALVMGLKPDAASKRYVRALLKVKKLLAGMPGGLEAL